MKAWRIRYPVTARFTTIPANTKALPTSRRSSTHLPGLASSPGRSRALSSTQHTGAAGRPQWQSPGHERVWHHQLQFGVAQREPDVRHAILRPRSAAFSQRLRRAAVVFHTIRPAALFAGPARRSSDQRRGFRHRAAVLDQRHPGRWLLSNQSGAYRP